MNDYNVIKISQGKREKEIKGKDLMNKAINQFRPLMGQNSQAKQAGVQI